MRKQFITFLFHNQQKELSQASHREYSMKLLLSLFFLIICTVTNSSFSIQPFCHDNERSALLQFMSTLSVNQFASTNPSAYSKTESWKSIGKRSNCCMWDGIACDKKSGHVTTLDLSSSCLRGFINPNSTIFNLIHLHTLNLADNDFQYSRIPSRIGCLSNLKYLILSKSHFFGQIPIEISNLSKLIYLDLSFNVEPSTHAHLLELRRPTLRSLVQNFSSLKELRLSKVNISSQVPKILANLTSLRTLLLKDCGLHGSFPKGIFLLPNLMHLHLGNNHDLFGSLPKFHNGSKLQWLSVTDTRFFGKIPPSISNLKSLTTLRMDNCIFEGPIPYSLGMLNQLTDLELGFNNFEGQIPSSLGNLTQLEYLFLDSNRLRVELPSSLTNLTNLVVLFLGENNIHSSFPIWISRLENLKALDLDNILVGPVEFDTVAKLKQLQFLKLSYVDLVFPTTNWQNGTYPQFVELRLQACNLIQFPNILHNQTELEVLSLEDNEIQGSVPIPSEPMSIYDLSRNELSGEIPPLICNITSLTSLSLAGNSLSGRIPPCLGSLSKSLTRLELQGNYLEGTIPEIFSSSCSLKVIGLSHNQLWGRIPTSLANCSSLKLFHLAYNHINDTFPIWLQGLPHLHVLLLGSNRIHGVIPQKFVTGFPKLRIIDLSNNDLTGNLPSDLFLNLFAMELKEQMHPRYMESVTTRFHSGIRSIQVTVYSIEIRYKGVNRVVPKILNVFRSIDLSKNKLVGEIPETIGNLVGLQALNLSHNNLTGGIPSSLGNLSNIESLDLSHNMLLGQIPHQLTGLTFLEIFSVAYNHLSGAIPRGEQFDTFQRDSYEGNVGLCGTPLSKQCGNSESQSLLMPQSQEEEDEDSSSLVEWIIRSMGYLSGFISGVVLGNIIATKKHEWFVETFSRRQRNKRTAKRRGSRK